MIRNGKRDLKTMSLRFTIKEHEDIISLKTDSDPSLESYFLRLISELKKAKGVKQ